MEEKKKAVPEGEASLPVQELPADILRWCARSWPKT